MLILKVAREIQEECLWSFISPEDAARKIIEAGHKAWPWCGMMHDTIESLLWRDVIVAIDKASKQI